MDNNPIPIVFSANDDFIIYTSVMIQSIIENSNKRYFYKIFILKQEICKSYEKKILDHLRNINNISIEFIDINSYINNINFFVSGHISKESYFRLFIPYIFNGYKKILYFDSDMICLNDISELFFMDMKNKSIAAVRDIILQSYYTVKTKIKTIYPVIFNLQYPENYFNAGMLIWELETFRLKYSLEYLIKLISSRNWPIHDQDILNFLCNNDVYILPYKYNLMFQNPSLLPSQLAEDYNIALSSPLIIHFKPYKSWYFSKYSEYFWKYAAHSSFFDEIIDKMKLENKAGLSLEEYILNDIKYSDAFSVFFFIKCFFIIFFRKINKYFKIYLKKSC